MRNHKDNKGNKHKRRSTGDTKADENTFRAQPAGKQLELILIFIPLEVEFKVERRDSLGMVAKEHTQKIMKESMQGGLGRLESN